MLLRPCRLALASVLVVASALGAGCRKKVPADLVILTPHNERIQEEFAGAFSRWHQEKFARPVKVEWLKPGGGSSSTQLLLKQYERSETSGTDLYFGGGAPDHNVLAKAGVLEPVELPDATLAQLPDVLNGIRQYDAQRRWYGACMSSFGIFYNKALLESKKLPVPRTWDDLAAPAMFGLVSAADASQSSSARAAYELIVQSAPDWPSGWAKLLMIFANCRNFRGGASDVLNDVANGDVLAGLAIDYYAYMQMAAKGEGVGFALVGGSMAFTPDPIALLKGAPHADLARKFVEFVLSERGQALFCLEPGSPNGPAKYALYRQPVRRDMYDKYAGKMLPPLVNPFVQAGQSKYNVEAADVRVGQLCGPLMKAAVLDSREQMGRAWKAILDAGLPPELVRQFVALPADLADEAACLATARRLSDDDQREAITSAWQRYWRGKYEEIARKGR